MNADLGVWSNKKCQNTQRFVWHRGAGSVGKISDLYMQLSAFTFQLN